MLLLKNGLHWFLVELYQAYLYSYDDFRSRPVRSGAAWRRSPHQKSAGRDQKKKKRREERKRKEKRRKKRERRQRKERERGVREKDVLGLWVSNTLLKLSKGIKHTKRGGWKSFKKAGREEEETEMARQNMVTENRSRCENIGYVFYSNTKPLVLNHIYHSWTFCQFYSSCQKRDYHLNGDPFFVSEYSDTRKYASNCAN